MSRNSRYYRSVVLCLLFLAVLVPACSKSLTLKIPIDTLQYKNKNRKNQILIIFLPGAGNKLDAFSRHGFVRAVHERKLAIDMISVNAHLGYYAQPNLLVVRLKTDVITPAKAQGYKKIWLVGNSLGALGSLLYIKAYPQDIEGVLLLGPFLGQSDIIEEINEAGGLKKWQPGLVTVDDRQRILWSWLKNYNANSDKLPKLYLGYGNKDKFAAAHNLLASSLPSSNVFVLHGQHRWSVWIKLWQHALDKSIFSL